MDFQVMEEGDSSSFVTSSLAHNSVQTSIEKIRRLGGGGDFSGMGTNIRERTCTVD